MLQQALGGSCRVRPPHEVGRTTVRFARFTPEDMLLQGLQPDERHASVCTKHSAHEKVRNKPTMDAACCVAMKGTPSIVISSTIAGGRRA